MRNDLADAYELYAEGQRQRAAYIRRHPEYHLIVERMRQCQRITPLTQLIFDWPENGHQFSAWLRKHLPGYGQLKDWLN
jgi:hypothetical protein